MNDLSVEMCAKRCTSQVEMGCYLAIFLPYMVSEWPCYYSFSPKAQGLGFPTEQATLYPIIPFREVRVNDFINMAVVHIAKCRQRSSLTPKSVFGVPP